MGVFHPHRYELAAIDSRGEIVTVHIFEQEKKAVEALLNGMASPRCAAHSFLRSDGDNSAMKRIWWMLSDTQ
jgi:hypothetical protein